MVHRLLSERLGRPVHSEIEPDLAVAMGAAVQGGLIAGVEVGAMLVDITPHTLGIETLGLLNDIPTVHFCALIIERNIPLHARAPRSSRRSPMARRGRISASSKASTKIRGMTPSSGRSRSMAWLTSRPVTRSLSGSTSI